MATNVTSDEAFNKEVIEEGSGLYRPNEWATCKVIISPSSALPDAEGIIGYPVDVECEVCIGTGMGRFSFIIDECIQSMRSGEKCRLTFDDAKMAKSPDGFKCECIIKLIEFMRSKDIWEMTPEEKLTKASLLKDSGTKCFKEGMTDQAEVLYLRGLKYVIAAGEVEDPQPKLLLSLNVAACQLKHKRYKAVIAHCTNALAIDKNSSKALFRRGQAFMALQDYELAQSDFDQCVLLEPNSKAVQTQIELLTTKRKKLDAHYAQAMSKMFGKVPAVAEQQ